MFNKKSTLSTIALLLCCIFNTYAQKPILPDYHADPSVHYWAGKFWMYPSTDEPGSTSWKQMCRWSVFSSRDLVNWQDEGEIFSLKDIAWADYAAFAPDAAYRNGKYYFVYPAEMQIGVAVSGHPTGPFVDAIGKPLIKKDVLKGIHSFDPCIFIDDDEAKTPYLYYGNGGVGVVKLKDNLIEFDGELTALPIKDYAEGIWVHKHNGTYYFTYPNHYKDEEGNIKQLLVYSTAPTPLGPFTYHGAFLDNKSRNSHHSIIEVDGQSYLFYHIEGPSPYERRVCAEYLEYDKNGLIKEVKMTKKGIKPLKVKSPLLN